MNVIKTQQAWIVKVHIDKVDMTDLGSAERAAGRLALDAVDKKLGLHAWITDSIFDGTNWVVSFRPMGSHVCSKCELAVSLPKETSDQSNIGA